MKKLIFVGCNAGKPWEVFRNETIPTHGSHGHLYDAVIGPFRTIRGAKFMETYGRGNPHCRNVCEAEHLARKYKDEVEL